MHSQSKKKGTKSKTFPEIRFENGSKLVVSNPQNAHEKNTNTRTITPRIDEKNGKKDRMLQKKYTFLHSKRLPKQKKYHAAWDIKVNGNMGSIIILNLLIHAVKFLYHAMDAYF